MSMTIQSQKCIPRSSNKFAEHEAWSSEYVSQGRSGTFGNPNVYPPGLQHLRKQAAPLKRYAVEIRDVEVRAEIE